MEAHIPLKQVLLIILDGWGIRSETKYNAIAAANPEYMNYLWETYPHTQFQASGEAVGLPEGIIGTSEIGHTIIGAGKVIDTDLVRVFKSIKQNTLKDNPAINALFTHVKEYNSTLHFIGLVSPGGVHSHQEHLFALIKLAKEAGISKIAIHAFTDGRDTGPQSGYEYISQLDTLLKTLGIGRIATVGGRYFGMDRDNNWDRIEKAENAIFNGSGEIFQGKTAEDIVKDNYAKGTGDEFIPPAVLLDDTGKATTVTQNDGVMYFNFRPDRARELSERISEKAQTMNLCFVTLTQYDAKIPSLVAFPPETIKTTLAAEIAKAGLTQTHIAETEKYAHVTYFLNGGNEKPHEHEEFVLIPSRKDVPTHDLAPHMRAEEIADRTIQEIEKGTNFIAINICNADMVGHTGKWDATVEAVKFEDTQIKRVVEAILEKGGVAFITADHGNAELMFDEKTQQPYTAHTLNPIPGILTLKSSQLKNPGSMADIAPTILDLFGLQKPTDMTGSSLIEK